MNPITARECELLMFIELHVLASGFPPTVREMATSLNISSTNGIRNKLIALEKKGFIKRHYGCSRGIQLLAKATP